jgi:signal transduction histidine kinase
VRRRELHAAAPVVLAFVLGLGTVGLLNGARRIGQVFPGFLVAENLIVVSIGRTGWSFEKADRIAFAKVIAIQGRPIDSATALAAQVAGLGAGSPVTYRFRKHADVFTAVVETQRFGGADFLALYATYFLAAACFALSGFWVTRQRPPPPGATGFFVLCETVALVLGTGGDIYGPYWFTPLYFLAQCIVPVAILHFAGNYPDGLITAARWRRVLLAALYTSALAIGIVLNLVADEPSLFLPLLYTLYLLLANTLLLYLARLAIGMWSVSGGAAQRSLRLALAAFLVSATVPGVIFVIYPALKAPISPTLLVAPLAAFAPLTAIALRCAAPAAPVRARTTARARLSLLFLGAVETAFLAALGTFWLGSSWSQLTDDLAVNQRQQALATQALSQAAGATVGALDAIEGLVQTLPEEQLLRAARDALARQEPSVARQALTALHDGYRAAAARLGARRQRLNHLGASLVVGLVVAGIAQAVGFMIAVQRWLIRPVERLTAATGIIATGDLGHRVALDGAREFVELGEAVNAMAASLADIQRRIDEEQQALQRAAGAARDAERKRLARELHDGTLQELSALKLRLEGMGAAAAATQLQGAIDAIIQVIVGLRQIVDDLGAPDLSRLALNDALTAYARIVAQAHGVELRTELAADAPVAEWAARDVYRIAQETLTNAVRHGSPQHLVVQLYSEAGRTVLEVRDDGAGFDLDTVALGTGIRGMRERAAAIGAKLEIRTAPRHGTTVRLTVPAEPTPGKPGLPAGPSSA